MVERYTSAGSLFEDAAPQEDLSPKGTWTGTVYTPAAKVPVARADVVEVALREEDRRDLVALRRVVLARERGVALGQAETLAKLGITPTRTLDQSQERTSLSNVTELAKYHVVFLPCGSCVTNETNTNGTAEDPAIKGALRDYVTKGGKVYVTDWKQGFVSEGFPGYVDFAQAKGCSGGIYEVNAIVKDQGLDDWLKAQGTPANFQLKANYQRINGVKQVFLEDGDGGTRVYSPKVWMSGNQSGSERPQTVSFEYGCGRVLYSTYHTENKQTGLDEQEKALFYILFEVASTCIVDPIIPK